MGVDCRRREDVGQEGIADDKDDRIRGGWYRMREDDRVGKYVEPWHCPICA